jgi:hypothetical protein
MEEEGRSDEEQRDDAAPTALLLDAAARTATLRHIMVLFYEIFLCVEFVGTEVRLADG